MIPSDIAIEDMHDNARMKPTPNKDFATLQHSPKMKKIKNSVLKERKSQLLKRESERPSTVKHQSGSPSLDLSVAGNLEPYAFRNVSFPNRKVHIKSNFDKQRSLYKSIVEKT